MKPLTKCLAAGSLAALALFGYYERTTIHSFFNAESKSTSSIIKTQKKDVFAQSAEQLKQAAPLIAEVKAVDNNETKQVTNKTQQASATVVAETPIASTTASYISHAVVPSYKHIVLKKEIDIAQLTKKMSASTGSMDIASVAPAIDSADMNNSMMMVAENSVKAETETAIAQPEKVEMVPAFSMPRKMAGTAYEGTVATSSVKLPSYNNNTLVKAALKADKNNQKASASTMSAAFASVSQVDNGADSYSYASLFEGTEQLREFAERSGSNTDFGIIVNLGIKSGKKRFFVIDLSSNTIVKSGVVAEGSGDIYASYKKAYSNEPGSMASSLGVYKIGKRAKTSLSYQLFGMQESNSNAAKRSMMLQASEDVPYEEINFPLLKTDGSLSLSARFLKEISPMLNDSVKPVLLWVCDPAAESQSLYSKNN